MFDLDTEAHVAEVETFRAARLSRLTAAESWLSLVGKSWLELGDNLVGGEESCSVVLPHDKAPAHVGVFTVSSAPTLHVTFTPAAHVSIMLRRAGNTEPVTGRVQLTTDAQGEPDRLQLGTLLLEVMQRGDTLAVRVRDRESLARTSFPGLDYFPIDPRFRIVAELERYTPDKRVELDYETGAHATYVCPYAARFSFDGVSYRVDPVLEGSRLFLIFADATNRDSSYGAGRFLYAPLPRDEKLVLDFNLAFNPPCAFTPYAVCPLPPPQNRLPLRIEAGEKRPLS